MLISDTLHMYMVEFTTQLPSIPHCSKMGNDAFPIHRKPNNYCNFRSKVSQVWKYFPDISVNTTIMLQFLFQL